MSNKKGNTVIGLIIISIIIILTVVGIFFVKPQSIIIQGEVEATQIRVATKIFGRVDSLFIKEGNSVTKGELLLSVNSPEIEAKLKQAMAAQTAAGAQKDKAYFGARKEKVRAAYNLWQTAKAGKEFAEKTFNRIDKLFKDGVVSAQKFDEVSAKYKVAEQQEKAAKASYDMASTGARKEDKVAAKALEDRASGAVLEVESYLEETLLKSPIDGEIAEIIAKRGELISPGYPIINIVDLTDIWITFNLREDLLKNFKMNSEIEVVIPALGDDKITFKINYIQALGNYATWSSTKVAGDFDLKTFEVRAVPIKKIENLRPGMTVILPAEDK